MALVSAYFLWMPILEIQYTVDQKDFKYTFESSQQYYTINNGVKIDLGSNQLTMFILIALMLFSFISIFLYKNRNLQRNICYINYLLIVGLAIFQISNWMGSSAEQVMALTFKSWIHVLIIFFLLIINMRVIKGINRDDALVKSADRIR